MDFIESNFVCLLLFKADNRNYVKLKFLFLLQFSRYQRINKDVLKYKYKQSQYFLFVGVINI